MTTWFTADTHFHHKNISRLAERPWDDLTEMNERIIQRWNESVRPDDDIWVLGDYVLGSKRETLEITARLMGRKHLIVGNHDGPFDQRPAKAAEWLRLYLEHGFDSVHFGSVGYRLGDLPVLLSHFPYQADERHENKYIEHHPVDAGLPLIHGHVHGAWRQRGRQYNVGVDVNDFRPLALEEVYDWVIADYTDF